MLGKMYTIGFMVCIARFGVEMSGLQRPLPSTDTQSLIYLAKIFHLSVLQFDLNMLRFCIKINPYKVEVNSIGVRLKKSIGNSENKY